MKKNKNKVVNINFIDSVLADNQLYFHYLYALKRLATSMFEWVNLPESMNGEYLEKCLYYFGSATFLYDDEKGFINTNCASNGSINIYGLPTSFNCYSYGYQQNRILYTGLKNEDDIMDTKQCVLVMNNIDRLPTQSSIEMFAYQLYEAQATATINVIAQKTPVLIIGDEKQKLTLINLYSQYEGNRPVIFGDKDIINKDSLAVLKTDAPFVADKIIEYKKEIWNECLTFLGINNLQTNKKERLLNDEVNSNNECINLNLESMLLTRQKACKQFNELFNLTGNKAISVRVRSDLHNIIKNVESIVTDYKDNELIDNITKQGSSVINNG